MSNSNELISVTEQNNEFKISTTKGILIIEKDDAEAIKSGNFPSGIKNSPYLTGISLKALRREILKASSGIKKKDDGKNQATILWEMIQNSYFFQDQMGFSYIIRDNIPISVESEAFKDYLTYLFYNTEGIVPSMDSINLVQKMCRAKASQNILNVGVRTHKVGNDLIYDPINEDGSIVVVNKDGVTKVIPKQPYTVRYNGMLKAEIQNGELADLKTLLKLWNLDEDQEVLISGIIGTHFVAGIPHVIAIITGPHGAGKSSLSDALKAIPDPNIVTRNSLKFKEDEIAVSSLHEWVLNFDNVNTIMPDNISDLLCRISTGQGFKKRKLYTDQDDLILQYRRPIVINAINEPGYAPDFLDRALVIRLDLIPESKRKTDEEIQSLIESYAPKIRGLYLNILSKAVAIYPQVAQEYRGKLLRMADVILWGECITRSLGYEANKFYEAFVAVQQNETETSASENILIMSIEKLVERTNEWKGTTKVLYDELKGIMAEMGIDEHDSVYKQLPRNYRELGRRLTTFLPTLLNLGIEIKEDRNGKERTKIIKKIEPHEKSEQKNSSQEENKGDDLQKENKGNDNQKVKEEKNLDSFQNENGVTNVTNVTEPEKSEFPTSDITSDINNENVTNSKANDLISNEEEEGTQKEGDITKNNVTDNVTPQEPEKCEPRDISDVSDIPSMSKRNEKNNSEWGYFRVLEDFDHYYSSGKKRRCKKGQVVRFPTVVGVKYVLKGLLKPACPEGYWDPDSKDCIPGIGGDKNAY